MKLSVVLRHGDVRPKMVEGRRAAVIDVLRASTTIATALANGAEQVRVFAALDDARRMKQEEPSTLLAGERGGVKPDDFDLGNSPIEYTPQVVGGRDIAFSSTNGAKAVEAVLSGEPEALCLVSVVNLSAAVRFLAETEKAVLVCSGTEGGYSLEDSYCAGRIASSLGTMGLTLDCDEGALTALSVFERFGLDALSVFRRSNHGKVLIEYGFGKDLEAAAAADHFQALPLYKEKGFTSE